LALPGFSGPLDLLLALIRQRRLDVSLVSLASVADQYLAYVRALEDDLDVLSEFLAVGAQLLAIKCRALLPLSVVEATEAESAESLTRRLAEYAAVQHAALWLAERETNAGHSWGRGGSFIIEQPSGRLALISVGRLTALAGRDGTSTRATVVSVEPSPRPRLRECLRLLARSLRAGAWTRLDRQLGPDVATRVATFLALLLMVRRGLAEVQQPHPFATLRARVQPGSVGGLVSSRAEV
jgi:segregation and condensation protein A